MSFVQEIPIVQEVPTMVVLVECSKDENASPKAVIDELLGLEFEYEDNRAVKEAQTEELTDMGQPTDTNDIAEEVASQNDDDSDNDPQRSEAAVIIQNAVRTYIARKSSSDDAQQVETKVTASGTMFGAVRSLFSGFYSDSAADSIYTAEEVASQNDDDLQRSESAVIIQNAMRKYIATKSSSDVEQEEDALNEEEEVETKVTSSGTMFGLVRSLFGGLYGSSATPQPESPDEQDVAVVSEIPATDETDTPVAPSISSSEESMVDFDPAHVEVVKPRSVKLQRQLMNGLDHVQSACGSVTSLLNGTTMRRFFLIMILLCLVFTSLQHQSTVTQFLAKSSAALPVKRSRKQMRFVMRSNRR